MKIIKVTIIDDDLVTQNILFNMFQHITVENVEFEITRFNNGIEFLESSWHDSEHKHIVLIEDLLPMKSGLEILHEIRKMTNSSRFIVIILGTRDSENDMIYALESGAEDYVSKPFNLRLMEARIKRFIKELQ